MVSNKKMLAAGAALAAVAAAAMVAAAPASAVVNQARTIAPDNLTPGYTVNLPDQFRETREFDGQRYFGETVNVTVKNSTGMDQHAGLRYKDQQGKTLGDHTELWIASGRVDALDAIIKAGETKTITFDVWFDDAQGAIGQRLTPTTILDVPDDLALDFGLELHPAVFITDGDDHTYTADMPRTLSDPELFADDGKYYYKTKITIPVTNRTNEDREVVMGGADQQEYNSAGKAQLWIERGVFDNWRHDTVIKAGETKEYTFDVWFDNGYTAKQIAAQGNKMNLSTAINVDFHVETTPVG